MKAKPQAKSRILEAVKHPSGPSLKLLNLLDRKGLEAVI